MRVQIEKAKQCVIYIFMSAFQICIPFVSKSTGSKVVTIRTLQIHSSQLQVPVKHLLCRPKWQNQRDVSFRYTLSFFKSASRFVSKSTGSKVVTIRTFQINSSQLQVPGRHLLCRLEWQNQRDVSFRY